MTQTLIVCEKPDAAARVARALDVDGDLRPIQTRRVPLFECRRGKESIFVCSALGHLYAVDSKSHAARRYYPEWDLSWKPKHLLDKESARLANWIDTIKSVAANCDRFINACDFDVEGSLIGLTILRYACNGADSKAQRMKFSTMTEKELQTSYKTPAQRLDYTQAAAAQCRHELDWLYGINLTRVLTESALKQNRGYSTLSTGRVQGPTLKFVVDREEEIQCFAPTPFWKIDAAISHKGSSYELDYEKEKIPTLSEAAKVVDDCKNQTLKVDDKESRNIQQPPPHPFDLSTLQAETYRHFGYSPARTLAYAERLYLDALISYPRTSSQQLPPDISYTQILESLSKAPQYSNASKLITSGQLHPSQGQKQDPAHPAIYPTGELPRGRLPHQQANLYDLIVKRFMATFAASSLRENTRLTLSKQPHKFFLRGSRLIEEGWIEFYKPYTSSESQNLPDLDLDDSVIMARIRSVENFTDPPPRYNPSSLLKKMEDANIGTKATRAEIIEVLYRRGYIKENRIIATPLATRVINILNRYCPAIADAQFTANVEEQMENIRTGNATRRGVILTVLENLRPIMVSLASAEDTMGPELAETVVAQRVASATLTFPCPSCSSKLRIIRSRASGKRFIGCSGYQTGCRFTLPLPQFGNITISNSSCKTCGFQLILVRSNRRRPYTSCPRCYTNKTKEGKNSGRKPLVPRTPSSMAVAT